MYILRPGRKGAIFGDYAGVEVDCCSTGFNQKVQLLLHFQTDRLQDAGMLPTLVAHTFKYRSSQLFEFIHSIAKSMLSASPFPSSKFQRFGYCYFGFSVAPSACAAAAAAAAPAMEAFLSGSPADSSGGR